MVYRRRRILLSELERQCGIALMAYDDAAAALQKHNADRFWYALQGLTAAAGHLEGILWPVPNAAIGWASELREALGLQGRLASASPWAGGLQEHRRRPGGLAGRTSRQELEGFEFRARRLYDRPPGRLYPVLRP